MACSSRKDIFRFSIKKFSFSLYSCLNSSSSFLLTQKTKSPRAARRPQTRILATLANTDMLNKLLSCSTNSTDKPRDVGYYLL